MPDRRDVHYSEFGISSFEMLPALITGTEQDVVDAAYISRAHAERAKYEDNDRTEDTLRHLLLGGLIELSPEQEETIGRDIASFLIDFREGDAPEDKIDLNNNIYGRRLREMYPDREEFIAKAIEVADAMIKGEELPELDGVVPKKSFGSYGTPEALLESEKENQEPVMEIGPDGNWQFTEQAKREREAAGLDIGGLLSRPPRMLKPEEKEQWTDDTIDLMNRMQFDSDEIVDRTPNLPSLMRQIDEYLVGEAPYYANVDRDSIGDSRIFLDGDAYGGYATERAEGKQAFYAGATEQPAQDDYILHETAHLSEDEMRHSEQEAAVTFLDFYRNAKRLQNPELSEDDRFRYEDRIRTAKAYLKEQGFNLDDPEDAAHVSGLASNYVLHVGLSINPDMSMDEYRETTRDLKSVVNAYNQNTDQSTEMDEGGLMLAPGGAVTKALTEAGEKVVEGVRDLFHGTPKTFDRFEDETFFKENTQQANFGLGHNLAENPLYAEGYRQRAAANPTMTIDGETITIAEIADPKEREFLQQQFAISNSNEKRVGQDLLLPSENAEYIIGMAKFHGLDEDSPIVKKLLNAKEYDIDPGGNLYKVQFDAPDETLLNFSTAISDQPKEVQDALSRTEIGAFMLREEEKRIEKIKGLVDNYMAQGYDYTDSLEYANRRFPPVTGRQILAQFDRGLGSDAATRQELMGQGLRGIEWVNNSFGQFKGDKNFVAFTAKYLSPTAKALGLSAVALGLTTEEAEAAYIPLKAFAEGSDAAKAFFAKAQKRIDEGADTAPNGELYNEMGVYKSEDGDLKVDVPELRARDVEAMNAIANFQEDLNFYLKSTKQRRKATSNPITRYLPENSPIFENFPDLKNAKFVMEPSKDKAGGGVYRTASQELVIFVDPGAKLSDDVDAERIAMKTMSAFNTFIHEFQHHIQDVKKAANTGYSPVASGVGFKGFKQDYLDAVDAIDKLQPGEIGYDQFQNRINMMFDLVRDSYGTEKQRVAFDRATYEDKVAIVKDRIENFERTKGKKGSEDYFNNTFEGNRFGSNIYYRELGEAEARSAAAKGLLVGDQRKAVGIYYPKDTFQSRRVLSPEDIQLDKQIENTHILVRAVPAYNFGKFDTDMLELEVTGAAPKKPSLLEKQQDKGDSPSALGPAVVAGTAVGLASPPSEAFVAGLGFDDPTPTASLFDAQGGAIPNELGITNTFLLDLLVPRTKPYDIISNTPLGVGMLAGDLIDMGIGDFLRGEGTEAGQRIRNEAQQKGLMADGP